MSYLGVFDECIHFFKHGDIVLLEDEEVGVADHATEDHHSQVDFELFTVLEGDLLDFHLF